MRQAQRLTILNCITVLIIRLYYSVHVSTCFRELCRKNRQDTGKVQKSHEIPRKATSSKLQTKRNDTGFGFMNYKDFFFKSHSLFKK